VLRILVTGAGGFVGSHLTKHLQEVMPDAELHGTTLSDVSADVNNVPLHKIDLKDAAQVRSLLSDLKPDRIYHLAAQAFVPRSFEEPWETLENNILAQLNLIQESLKLELRPRLLVVGSAEIYGPVRPEELPLTEDSDLRPSSPYSVSKIAQDMLGLQYHLSHDLPIMRARPFNHFGPGQRDTFVAPGFATQIAAIESGEQPPVLKVGDLSAQRDFTDVRDIVRAYRLIIEQGEPGQVYNVCSGQAHSIQHLLDTLLSYSSISIEVRVDPDRLRPVTVPVLEGSYDRLHRATGWEPQIPFERTLADILNDCRQRINSS
jgi:GDP-4-dehydro-6-deoxy-D-mannose reductase